MVDTSSQIAIDLAKKCANDVAAAINRALALCPDQTAAAAAVTDGVLASLNVAAGYFDGFAGADVGTTSLREVALGVVDALDAEATNG